VSSSYDMILRQFYLNCLAHASYLIGDETSETAAVVDPQRDVDQYLAFAAAHGLTIRHVILTHFHADFVAGHLELQEQTGATIYLGRSAQAEYAFTPFGDGDSIAFGNARLAALETPGHTPESISILVYDRAVSDAVPHAVLTGDTLFVGDVGRPDLRAALGWSANDLGSLLYDSLHGKLLALPDSSLVYPAHGAGSLCGKALSKETVSTIGEQRRTNYALQPLTKDAFIALVTADQPDAPSYFTYDAVLNSRKRPTLSEALTWELQPLSLDDGLELQKRGVQLLDTRDAGEFAAAHLRGAINIGLRGSYATWAGSILDRERPIVIVADPGAERESALRLGRIGFDHVIGYLDGGMASAATRSDLVSETTRVSPEWAAEQLASTPTLKLIDVRAAGERATSSIERSIHIPLPRLVEDVRYLAKETPILVHCAGGYRSSTAASLLQKEGFTNVSELAGGITAWEASGHPVVKG
jgi:glyoxylase-like metal-dependent hydrolase (beta-lactamase superfamily II)/rhodanese-related sulfurtransferase